MTCGSGEASPIQTKRTEPMFNAITVESCACGAWRGELGLEPTPELYVDHLVSVLREVRRVLRDDGTLWLNIGDSYNGSGGGVDTLKDERDGFAGVPGNRVKSLKPKDLVGIPWRLAFALQADGWYLRSDIIWSKPNPMPESVTDRPTRAHEYLFLLTKSARYFYDIEGTKEPIADASRVRLSQRTVMTQQGGSKSEAYQEGFPGKKSRDRTPAEILHAMARKGFANTQGGGGTGFKGHSGNRSASGTLYLTRNLRSVWSIPTQPFPEAHFATYPEKLVEPCIKAGTSDRGICGNCGAPWEREVRKRFVQEGPTRHRGRVKGEAGEAASKSMTMGDGGKVGHNEHETVSWHPTCQCTSSVGTALVLDPFCGSGTTGVVALKLGRRFLGLELQPEYVKMAERRVGGVMPLFAGVPA